MDSGDGSEVFAGAGDQWQLQGLSLSWAPAPPLNFWSDRATELHFAMHAEVPISSSVGPVAGVYIRRIVSLIQATLERQGRPIGRFSRTHDLRKRRG